MGADGVVDRQACPGPGLEKRAYPGIFDWTLRCLGEYVQWLVGPDCRSVAAWTFTQGLQEHGDVFDDCCIASDLPHESEDFRMAYLTEYYQLSACGLEPFVGFPDPLLQAQDHRTGAVYATGQVQSMTAIPAFLAMA